MNIEKQQIRQEVFEQTMLEHHKKESPYSEALSRDKNPANVRAILHICKLLTASDVQGEEDMMMKSSSFAGALLIIGNSDKNPATSIEVSFLYDMLFEKFGDNQKIRWFVDYHPQGDFADVLQTWRNLITKTRNEAGLPKLPIGSLGYKTSFEVEDGCATTGHGKYIIDNKGNTVNNNLWEIAFNEETVEAKQIAKQIAEDLQPVCPKNWKISFRNRDSVRKLGLSFKDAEDEANADNWGLVKYLITLSNEISVSEGYPILRLAITAKKFDICLSIFSKGIPIIDVEFKHIFDSSMSSNFNPFIQMIIDCDFYNLEKLLNMELKIPNTWLTISLCEEIIDAIYTRYRTFTKAYDIEEDRKNFNKLFKLWSSIYKSQDDESKVLFYKAIYGKFYKEELKNPKYSDFIERLIEGFMPELRKFNNCIAEVKHFPSYISGCQKSVVKSQADSCSERLENAFNSLNEEYKNKNQQLFNVATRLLQDTVNRSKVY